MKGIKILLLLLASVICVNGCIGGGTTKRQEDPDGPRVLPVRTKPIEEVIAPQSTRHQVAANPSGSNGLTVSTTKLRNISEQLLTQDVNNVGHLFRPNHQGKTTSAATDDKAQGKLFPNIPPEALSGKTIAAMLKLLDNYFPNAAVQEDNSKAEITEVSDFLNAIMDTQIMKTTEKFLKDNRLIRRNLRDVLNEIWFDLYKRAGRHPGSSGFEHVFIGETKGGKVSGFHNWVTFYHEEQDNDLDYKGFMKYVSLGNKGQILSNRFVWLNVKKPVTSIFIGTSPELEMALYTICFYARPSKACPVQLNNKRFNIQTYPFKFGKKTLVGSAFPLI